MSQTSEFIGPSCAELCSRGDPESLAALQDRHAGFFGSVARQRIRNEADVEDVLQEFWQKVYRNIDQYDETLGAFRTWGHRILRNTIVDHGREQVRIQRHLGVPAGETALAGVEAESGDPILVELFRTDYKDCHSQLNGHQQELAERVLVEGEKQKDLAEECQQSPAKIHRQKVLVSKLLRDCLESKGWTGLEIF